MKASKCIQTQVNEGSRLQAEVEPDAVAAAVRGPAGAVRAGRGRGRASEAASRTRSEIGAVRLTDRLRGAVGSRVALQCSGAGQVSGELVDVGPDWLLLSTTWPRRAVRGRRRAVVAGLTRRTGAAEEGMPSPRRGTCAGRCVRWRGTGPPCRSCSTTAGVERNAGSGRGGLRGAGGARRRRAAPGGDGAGRPGGGVGTIALVRTVTPGIWDQAGASASSGPLTTAGSAARCRRVPRRTSAR